MGAGAVSLAAKAAGFEVQAGDIAERSAIVGRGIIANCHVRLSITRTLDLLEFDGSKPLATDPAILDRLQPPRRRFFRGALQYLHSRAVTGIERDLLQCLVMRLLVHSFPLSLPEASDAPHAAAGEYDRLSSPRLAHYLRNGAISPASVLRARADVNASVLAGRASFERVDAFDLLRTDAEVAVLDPPYPGTQRYERAFQLLDDFLGGDALPDSAFSSAVPPIEGLLEACSHIPVVVLCAGNARIEEQEWMRLVGRHRTVVRSVSIPYRHYGAIATDRKNRDNREILILATKGPT